MINHEPERAYLYYAAHRGTNSLNEDANGNIRLKAYKNVGARN